MDLRLDDSDPHIRDLAYLLFLEEALGGEWVERSDRERGKLDALRGWREARPASSVAKDRSEKAPAWFACHGSRRSCFETRSRSRYGGGYR